MKRDLQFLTDYISPNIIETKVNIIEDAFITNDCFDEVPNKAGIYLMLAKKVRFIYPRKKTSPVFYIGTSDNLKKRLKEHLRLFNKAAMEFKKDVKSSDLHWHYSRYNYANAYGVDLYYMRITGRESSKCLESKAIEGFYDKYGALPVGNGSFSFRKKK